jgi:hypothetical protein
MCSLARVSDALHCSVLVDPHVLRYGLISLGCYLDMRTSKGLEVQVRI